VTVTVESLSEAMIHIASIDNLTEASQE